MDNQVVYCIQPSANITSFHQLNQVELLCQQLYESTNSEVRSQAEKTLMGYFDSPNAPAHCQVILEQSQVSYHVMHHSLTIPHCVVALCISIGSINID